MPVPETVESTVAAVVLAAGASSRMGRPKALMPLGSGTFLEHWLTVLEEARVATVRVVLGRDAPAIRGQVALADELVVINPDPDRGMLSSFVAGLDALPAGVAGVFLCPVDHPDVQAGLLDTLRRRLQPGRIVVPVHGGRRGHPALFAADLMDEIRAAPANVGARAVVRSRPDRVVEVAAGPGILTDVDTPEDLRRTRGSDHDAAVDEA